MRSELGALLVAHVSAVLFIHTRQACLAGVFDSCMTSVVAALSHFICLMSAPLTAAAHPTFSNQFNLNAELLNFDSP